MLEVRNFVVKKRLAAFFAGVGILLLILLLSACGYNGSAVGSPAPTSPTPTPPLQVKNCGSLHTMRLLLVPTDQQIAKQDETCFAQAYAACHPATLSYSQNSLDTGTIHNFSIKNQNGKCTITDVVQTFVAPRAPKTSGTYTCGSAAFKADGLHIYSCGPVGDIFMPATNTQ
ncbi:MAG TPA: hypothetical protein VF043_29635 [Ktedonobacteraceae bacterium]